MTVCLFDSVLDLLLALIAYVLFWFDLFFVDWWVLFV